MLLQSWSAGDEQALERLTALIHEAYLRLVDAKRINCQNRAHRAKRSRRALILVLIQKRAKDGVFESHPFLESARPHSF